MSLFILLSGCFSTKTDPTETGADTRPNVDDLPQVEAQLESSGAITCDSPDIRSQTPMTLADFGADGVHNQLLDIRLFQIMLSGVKVWLLAISLKMESWISLFQR